MKNILFMIMPANWGLSGKRKDRALAEYQLKGEELERKVASIDFEGNDFLEKNLLIDKKYGKINEYEYDIHIAKIRGKDELELSKEYLNIDRRYNKIDQYTYDIELTKLTYKDDELKHRLLRVEYEHHRINEQEYDKQIAVLLDEPYIGVKSSHFDLTTGRFAIEYDWNDKFIDLLIQNGFAALTDADVVQKWFSSQDLTNESETLNQPPVIVD